MSSSSSVTTQDKATSVNLTGTPVTPPPHKWHVNEIITVAYTNRSVDIENPNHTRGPSALNYPADRYLLHTMEKVGIFDVNFSNHYIDFCTNQAITCEYTNEVGGVPFRRYGSDPCSFIEFLIHNNLVITFREVIQHNDPVFRFTSDYVKCGTNCYHFKVLMTLLNTCVDPKGIFSMLAAVPIQEEWKDPTWWENMEERARTSSLLEPISPLYIELIGSNTFDGMSIARMKRRLHWLNCNGLLLPMWTSGLLRWYRYEAHSIPRTEQEFENEFYKSYNDYVRENPERVMNDQGSIRVRDMCYKALHKIWEFMLQLDAQYDAIEGMFVPRVPLMENMYMNTGIYYPNVGDEVIYRGKEEAYRGKQFQVVRCVNLKQCVLFNKTEVECQYVLNDMLCAVETGAICYDNYHLPGTHVKMFTAATCDLEFVSEYTPNVGDYCTMSTHTFILLKHVVEITRIPDNESGDYTVANNSRPKYKESKEITVRYEGTKAVNCSAVGCEKVHVFTILPDGKTLYIDMQKSYRSKLDVFVEEGLITYTLPSGVDMIIHKWIGNWNYAFLQPYAQYQHKMHLGELQTHVARYIPCGVSDCPLPVTALESTRNDVYIEFEEIKCFNAMLHPGQQVEFQVCRFGRKWSGTIKYILKHQSRSGFGYRCLDMFVIERNQTPSYPRSIRVVGRSDILSVESPQPSYYHNLYTNWILRMKGRAACNGLITTSGHVMTLDNFRSLLPYLTRLFKEDKGDIERYRTIRNDVDEHHISVHDAIPFSSQIYACPVEVGTVTEGELVSDDRLNIVEINWEKNGNGHHRYHALHLCQYLCKNAFVHGEIVSQNRVTRDRWQIPLVTYVEPTNARWPLKNETPYRHKIDVVRFLSESEIHEHKKHYEEKRKASLESGKKRSVDNNGNSSGSSTPEKRMRFDKDALKQQQIEQMRKMISDNKERLQALILRRDTAINDEHCDPQHLMRMCHPDPAIQQEAATAHAEMVQQLHEVNADIKHLETSIKTLEEKLSEKTKK